MDVQAATKFTSKIGVGLELVKVSNSSGSRWNKDTVGRMIDHIFYAGFNCRPKSCLADRKLDLSDHILANGPEYDSDNNITTDTNEKMEIWTNHFSELAMDTTGNSRSSSKWECLMHNDTDYFSECDLPIHWPEITAALNDTPNNKTPGSDRIPS
ncbi:hypothetical protein AYI68_g4269 [Smittium mucronatum]|uniref:Uncharacterized protein n=1 Tax=Smittium mucronatum TaxID=133383 RepID=A0A1R0GXK1_9FUNG|nr:hypothetical protein AYI68_g4269 [Smittium mucronatum]